MRRTLLLAAFIVSCAAISFLPEPVLAGKDFIIKIFLSVALALTAFTSEKGIRRYFFSRTDALFWIYLALLALGIVNAPDRGAAWAYYRHFLICAVALYFVCRNEITFDTIRSLLYILTACASIVAIIGLLECTLKTNIIYEKLVANSFYHRYIMQGRLMSTLIHPNITGAYLLSCLPCAWFVYRWQSKTLLRLAAGTAPLLISAAILLTYSRGTWISLVLMLTLWSIIRGKYKYAAWAWGALLCILIVASQHALRIPNLSRYGISALTHYFLRGHRTLQYYVSMRMFLAHPFAGVGLTQYRALFSHFSPHQVQFEIRIPDSIYLMQLTEAGIFAFLAFVAFLLYIAKRALNTYRCDNREKRTFICDNDGMGGIAN